MKMGITVIQLKTSNASLFLSVLVASFLIGCDDGDKTSSLGKPTDVGVVSKTFIKTWTTEGGSINPVSQEVNYGQTATFTLIPDFGYQIDSVSGCEGTPEANQYTTRAITTACTVTASFKPLASPQNVTVQTGEQQLIIDWSAIEEAQSYKLYYDVEANIEPLHYASRSSAMMISDVEPLTTLTDLVNGMRYYLIVTAMHSDKESLPSEEVSAKPQSVMKTRTSLNDTGIDWCANDSQNNLTCPEQGYEGQDGERGRDALARRGQLPKIGHGAVGFDFTKLDHTGKPLPASANEWSCVRDNVTGLIWEVKEPAGSGGLRDASYTYSWYNPDSKINGGFAGRQNGGSCQGSDCDIQAFVDAVNAKKLCAANDWRIPTINDLLSIVHNGRINPAIDLIYFPNTQFTLGTQSHQYRSSSPCAHNSSCAFDVYFSYGSVFSNSKGHSGHVRLVRSGK